MCDYFGSKRKFTSLIAQGAARLVGKDIRGLTVIDACSGSGQITQAFAGAGANVISIDLLALSKTIINGSVGAVDSSEAQFHISRINSLAGRKGFFYNNYCPYAGLMYFTDNNASKIDACRLYIKALPDGRMKDYLLYCGLEALGRVQNTSGHQISYLKRFKKRAKDDLTLRLEPVVCGKVDAICGDVLSVLKSEDFKRKYPKIDGLYMDPPYNERQYGAYYHIYETFVRYDQPSVRGVVRSRDWKSESKSAFCSKGTFLSFLSEVLLHSPADKVLFSYSSDGLYSKSEIVRHIKGLGFCRSCKVSSMVQRRFKHSKHIVNTEPLFEYLFSLELVPVRIRDAGEWIVKARNENEFRDVPKVIKPVYGLKIRSVKLGVQA